MSGGEVGENGSRNVNESGRPWWAYMLWVVLTAIVGFTVAAVFAGIFEIPREWYLAIYTPSVLVVMYAYFRWAGADVRRLLTANWKLGVLVGAVVSVFTIRTVLMQESSETPEGASLLFNLTWLGLVYGVLDALLLSVLPVHATFKALEARGWTIRGRSWISAGLMAILSSMFVIGVYHLGYPEFRNVEVIAIMIAVAVQSLGYVVSRSPLLPIISHVAMHVAAVLYGISSVSQLPPHYF